MKTYAKTLAAAFLAISPIVAATSAQAVAPNFPTAAVRAINWEGFQTCKAMGDTGYTAVIKGILGDGGGNIRATGYHPFNIRTCFESRAQCSHFLDRIHHKVSQIEEIRYSRCNARG